MVAHVSYPKIVRDGTPASLSKKWIEGVLREKIGYRGLVVSDDLDMGGVLNGASIEDAAVGTLTAGSDMFLVCQKEEHVWRAWEAVVQRAERDRKFAGLIAAKAKRVAAFQARIERAEGANGSGAHGEDGGHAASASVGVQRRVADEFGMSSHLRSARCDCCGSDERDVGGRDRRRAGARAGARVSFATGVAGALSLRLSSRRSAGSACRR